MKIHLLFWCVGILDITIIVGACVLMVGKMPALQIEPYGWDFPFKAFILLTIPFILGYFAGRFEDG